MKGRKTFTVMAILVAVLILGVGYALTTTVNLVVNGTGNIKADADFSVEYNTTSTPVVTPAGNTVTMTDTTTHPVVAAAFTDVHTATMTVYLDKNNTSATACYEIDNKSEKFAAALSASVTAVSGTNEAYFAAPTYGFYSDSACSTTFSGSLQPESKAYLKVTIGKSTTEPLADVTNASFTVTTTATAEQPA